MSALQVLDLSAVDRDAGENAQLTFSVVAGDPEQKFYMVSHRQEQRGSLRMKKRLDYERPNEQRFNLTLKVLLLVQTHCPERRKYIQHSTNKRKKTQREKNNLHGEGYPNNAEQSAELCCFICIIRNVLL